MDIWEMMKRVQETEDLIPEQISQYWLGSLLGEDDAKEKLKYYYMKLLTRIRPIYEDLDDDHFYTVLEQSVSKALDRGIKFQVDNSESYMLMASHTYFKYFLQPDTDSLHLPNSLIQSFSRLDEIYQQLPALELKDEQTQIQLLSDGFEYPVFSTRLLYYSFMKWRNNQLRQVDIDLTVSLLPAPQRIEWEVFYEKDLEEIASSIQKNLEI